MTAKAKTDRYYMDTVGYEGRKNIWERPWAVISHNYKNLVMGTGANTYEKVVQYPPNIAPEYRGLWFAHNQYILLWQEFGLSGLGLFIIFFGVIIFHNLSIKNKTSDFEYNLKLSMVGIVILSMVHGYFDHQFTLVHMRNHFFIILALSELT